MLFMWQQHWCFVHGTNTNAFLWPEHQWHVHGINISAIMWHQHQFLGTAPTPMPFMWHQHQCLLHGINSNAFNVATTPMLCAWHQYQCLSCGTSTNILCTASTPMPFMWDNFLCAHTPYPCVARKKFQFQNLESPFISILKFWRFSDIRGLCQILSPQYIRVELSSDSHVYLESITFVLNMQDSFREHIQWSTQPFMISS